MWPLCENDMETDSMFRGFVHAQSANGGVSILGSSQFSLLTQKMKFVSIAVKRDSKIIIPHYWYKSVKCTVCLQYCINNFIETTYDINLLF